MKLNLFIAFQNLSSFLKNEIQSEKKNQTHQKLPSIPNFTAKTDGPNITLTRKYNDEE